MAKDNHPSYNPEEVIQRLINENRNYLKMINDVNLILTTQSEFDGLSIDGGVKTLMKKYLEEKNKVFELQIKIKKYEK